VFRKYLTIYLKCYKRDIQKFINDKDYQQMDDAKIWKALLNMINTIVFDYEREMIEAGIPKVVIEKMKVEYKYSKILFFSDTSINKILAKDFTNVFINENYEAMERPVTFDSTNFLIASFCFDVSEYSSRNKLAYGLHVYDEKMQLLSKPFNTMRNDMGLVQGNNVIADLLGKKTLFTPQEYEAVVRKFNDRLLKSKLATDE
jgi:hypothetical protein